MSETYFEKIERCRKKVSFKLARRLVKVLYHRPKMVFLGDEFNGRIFGIHLFY